MNTAVTEVGGASNWERLETAACPRCGSLDGRNVAEGRDYLYGVPGRFFAWQCNACGLQYQNPRPTAERLPQLYPASYGPHASKLPGETASPSLSWKERVKRHKMVSRVWPILRTGRAGLRSLCRRTGVGLFYPDPAELECFLRGEMGYSHLQCQHYEPEKPLSQQMRRECRRLAGIELVPHYVSDGRLLEIGCAKGDRLQFYRERGWVHLNGIELAEQAAKQAEQRGFRVACEPVESALERFSIGSFDVVVSSMVLEHLHNPFTVMRSIAGKLKPGGEFLFSTVTLDSLDARMFGPYWSGYDFPRHMVYFRMTDIRDMLAKDFDLTECFHQNAPLDFLRPATWRRSEGRISDRMIASLAKSSARLWVGDLLARMGQTSRVSFRCRKKQ